MTDKEYREIYKILIELQDEFKSEEEKLSEYSIEHTKKITELEQQIDDARKSEDIDFRVFSPRNVPLDNSEKIVNLEKEKNELEKELRVSDKQRTIFLSKSEKIDTVLFILKNSVDFSIIADDETGDNNQNEELEEDPFAFINNPDAQNGEENIEDNQNKSDSDSIFDELFSTNSSINNVFKSSKSVDNSNSLDTKPVDSSNEMSSTSQLNGIPVDDVQKVCHKVEFTEKIINNDRVRAKLELKEVITELNELIKAYQ